VETLDVPADLPVDAAPAEEPAADTNPVGEIPEPPVPAKSTRGRRSSGTNSKSANANGENPGS
jgi:hypothetical protein